MQRVFVIDQSKKPMTPCRPKRARVLLDQGKASVYRRYPFVIMLKESKPEATPRELRLKVDPGSKVSGLALVDDSSGEIVFGAEIEHRGQLIKNNLESRSAIRRGRRGRNCRYRPARWLNRAKPEGWLPPSLMSRIHNIETFYKKLMRYSNIKFASQELVRFDMQKMENPEISGTEYQQGTLFQYEVREYLLEKWNRTCVYCSKKDVPLEVEHVIPKAKGGSNRVSNLTIACVSCNQKKGARSIADFLKNKPDILKKIKAKLKAPLKDAAAVNATRWALLNKLKGLGLEVEVGSGGLTKYNRSLRGIPKEHWLDAACVGLSTPAILKGKGMEPLQIKAMGHGSRQMCRVDKFGFPRTKAKAQKTVKGFQTGDMVKAIVTKGKKVGTYIGRVAVRSSGSFNIKTKSTTTQGISWKFCSKIHAVDGYFYS